MNRKTLILFGAAGVLLVVAMILAISLRSGREGITLPTGNYDPYGTPSGGGSQIGDQSASQPISKTIGSITITQLDEGHYLLENKNGGYKITVTSDWILSKEDVGSKFKLYYGDAENLKTGGIEMNNIAVLTVEVLDNSNKYSFSEWFKKSDTFITDTLGSETDFKKVQTNAGSAFRSSRKLEGYDVDDNGEILLRDDSSIIDYLFFKNSEVYRVTCAAFGNDYKNLIRVCENQIENFSVR